MCGNVQKGVRQITDSIHGTIYISELEHIMMSTPFFYRLHDVYQSSTVYMTYPSNRTKRFEHSLGTMELAGQMFYSAITNASLKDKKHVLNELKKIFYELLYKLAERTELAKIDIYKRLDDAIDKLVPVSICTEKNFLEILLSVDMETFLSSNALRKQEVCFSGLVDINDPNPQKTLALYSFIYQCTLQALRIAALFHDIGHPPFSHIIEMTMKHLLNQKDIAYDAEKYEKFNKCLERYVGESSATGHLLLDICGYEGVITDSALHEQIGSHILYSTYRGVLERLIGRSTSSDSDDSLRAVYLLVVLEITFGILMEKVPVLASLHRIIDGPVDVDRLDYIVRDSVNSGVCWGRIPYSRIVNSARFVYLEDRLKIAFPEKVCDDLDDVFVNRYNIFQRINFHHKSIRTSELMQRSVELLAKDFLSSNNEEEISPEIHKLWTSLDIDFGQSAAENKISQWTDSWLVSVLSQALITLSDTHRRRELEKRDKGLKKPDLDKLYRMLEEVQLNRKRYFPLLKRHRDALHLRDRIVKKAGIDREKLQRVLSYEYHKLLTTTDDAADSARESLYRIQILQDKILQQADFSLLDSMFPYGSSYESLFKQVLDKALEDGCIQDYFLWRNIGFSQLGIDEDSEVYLYRRAEFYEYDKSTSLFPKLRAQRAGSLWMYIYVSLPECSEEEKFKTLDSLIERIADIIGEVIRGEMNSLFDFDQRIATES